MTSKAAPFAFWRIQDRARTPVRFDPPPPRPVDPGPVFIGDAAMPYGGGTMWLENYLRARAARDQSENDG